MIDEIEQALNDGTLIEKHIKTMSRDNESGISLSLVSMNKFKALASQLTISETFQKKALLNEHQYS